MVWFTVGKKKSTKSSLRTKWQVKGIKLAVTTEFFIHVLNAKKFSVTEDTL